MDGLSGLNKTIDLLNGRNGTNEEVVVSYEIWIWLRMDHETFSNGYEVNACSIQRQLQMKLCYSTGTNPWRVNDEAPLTLIKWEMSAVPGKQLHNGRGQQYADLLR